MRHKVTALIGIGLIVLASHATAQDREERRPPPAPVAPQPKTASDLYWDTVRATAGPIGFPKAVPGSLYAADPTQPSRPHGFGFGPTVFVSVPFPSVAAPLPAPVFVPVFVPVFQPGPTVDVPVPSVPVDTTPRVSSPPLPRTSSTFYVIAGCYVGNKPPQPANLRSGCDISQLRINRW